MANTVSAELSVTNQWRIEQAVERCKILSNALVYNEYWGDSVTDENRETVCIAEQFAQLAAFEGDGWLGHKAAIFIKECREKSNKDEDKYYACLNSGIEIIINQLSSPCVELGKEGLWETDRCNHLVSYIFLRKFEKVLEINQPLVKKLMGVTLLERLFNPIVAIVFLILFVFDIVVLTDPGNWMRIPRFAFVIGTVILVALFLNGMWQFLCFGAAVLISIAAIIRNHIVVTINKIKKKKEAQKRYRGII